MLYLVTGQPGNGKSLRSMALMVEEYERNQKAVRDGLEEPRDFYTNVTGAVLGELYEVELGKPAVTNPHAFPWVKRLPPHNDWTQLPTGSFVVYDEAHSDGQTRGLERYGLLFPATGKPGESTDPRIRAMSTHRSSFSMDLVLVTQFPSKVHHQVRSLVGTHIHMTRAMGLAAAGMLTWTRVQPDPYDERQREKAEEEVWTYPKDLYKRYISATAHTRAHKFRLPKKVKNGLITGLTLLLMLAGFWWFMGWDLGVFFGSGSQTQAKASVASPASGSGFFTPKSAESAPTLSTGMGEFAALYTEPAPTLMGCVKSDRGCRCFNSDGYVIDMSTHQCEEVLSKPLPFNVAHKFSRPSREDSDRRDVSLSPVEPVSGFSGGGVGTSSAPQVHASFGTITRGTPYEP